MYASNLADIRQRLFDQVDWNPKKSSEATARANRFINRALAEMAKDAPYCFFQSTGLFATQPDALPKNATDTIHVDPADPWVLTKDLAAATAQTAWPTDRASSSFWVTRNSCDPESSS